MPPKATRFPTGECQCRESAPLSPLTWTTLRHRWATTRLARRWGKVGSAPIVLNNCMRVLFELCCGAFLCMQEERLTTTLLRCLLTSGSPVPLHFPLASSPPFAGPLHVPVPHRHRQQRALCRHISCHLPAGASRAAGSCGCCCRSVSFGPQPHTQGKLVDLLGWVRLSSCAWQVAACATPYFILKYIYVISFC